MYAYIYIYMYTYVYIYIYIYILRVFITFVVVYLCCLLGTILPRKADQGLRLPRGCRGTLGAPKEG